MDRARDIPSIREHYARKGWAPLPKTLPVEVADATLYKIQKELGGDWESYRGDYIKTFLTEKKSFECYSFDYSPMATLQWGLTPYVATIVGKTLLPSHCYLRVYRQGDVCKVHSDAPDCEHSMSLTLGYSQDYVWEFNICERRFEPGEKRPAEQVAPNEQLAFSSVRLGVGDAVLYQGYNHLHGRLRPNPNRWAAQIFLHWIDRDGPYAAYAFDGRKDVVRRAEFVFPADDKPEKVNPNRVAPAQSRGR